MAKQVGTDLDMCQNLVENIGEAKGSNGGSSFSLSISGLAFAATGFGSTAYKAVKNVTKSRLFHQWEFPTSGATGQMILDEDGLKLQGGGAGNIVGPGTVQGGSVAVADETGALTYGGAIFDAMRDLKRPWASCDFFGVASADVSPFTGVALSSGTATAANGGNQIHGAVDLKNAATTISSGYKYCLSNAASLGLNGGEVFVSVFKLGAIASGATPDVALGYHDISTATHDATDGVYMVGAMDGTAEFWARASAGGVHTSVSMGTLAASTWYRLTIEINSDKTNAVFTIHNSATGALLVTAEVSSGFPTASQFVGAGAVAFTKTTPTAAIALLTLDLMGFGQGSQRALTR